MRPLCFLRNFVRFGCSISYRSSVPAAAARTAGSRTILEFLLAAVPSRRIVLENLAFEDPDLDADDAVGRPGLGERVVDVGPQGVQRHAALAVPLGPRDLGTAETAGDVDADAEGAHAHGVLHRPLHRAAERHPTLELLGDAFGHELC